MRIQTDDSVFIIPMESGISILIDNGYKSELIECFNSYFIQKKKTKCIIYDNENDPISNKDFNFIYISEFESIEKNFDFVAKSYFNTEISKIIETNQEKFQTIERVRDSFSDLLTDAGMYDLSKILAKNLKTRIELRNDNFDITKVLSFLSLDVENMTCSEKMLIIYNLMLFVNRDKFNIIFIDFEIDSITEDWIEKTSNMNTLIIINNESISQECGINIDSVLIMSENDSLVQEELDYMDIGKIIYAFHPIVVRNPSFQNEEIIGIYKKFYDPTSTFLINILP